MSMNLNEHSEEPFLLLSTRIVVTSSIRPTVTDYTRGTRSYHIPVVHPIDGRGNDVCGFSPWALTPKP